MDQYLPTINTNFSFFGGHIDTVEPGWRWPTEHHPAFEIIYLLTGTQRTVTEFDELLIHAGEMTIIPINVDHTNYCYGDEDMTFFTMHFNLDDPAFKYLLIKNFNNRIINANDAFYPGLKQNLENIIHIIGQPDSLTERLTIEFNTINIISLLTHAIHPEKLPFQKEVDHFALYQQIAARLKNELNEQIFNNPHPHKISVSQIIGEFHISQSMALKLFQHYRQMSPQKYLQSLKMQIAKNLLLQPAMTTQDVAYKLNYSSPSHFSREFKRFFNMTPREYIRSQR